MLAQPDTYQLNEHPVFVPIMKLRNDLETYLECTVSATDVIASTDSININKRSAADVNLVHMAMLTSANKSTLQALFEHNNQSEKFIFDPENSNDRGILSVFLMKANPEAVEYLMTKIDINPALLHSNGDILHGVINSRNIEVIKSLLKNLVSKFDFNTQFRGDTILGYALKFRDASLARFALDNGTKIFAKDAADIITRANGGPLLRKYEDAKSKQEYTYEHYIADHWKGIKRNTAEEEKARTAWEELAVNQLAAIERGQISANAPLIEYTQEQFQAEHQEEYDTVAAWKGMSISCRKSRIIGIRRP